ncbi:MAG: ankyrin repeat domain-containing protein [Azonexaceae bacterium]|nr:ankyrin repeat domain-containing protein [Azonexaceae bacterium]
MTFKGFTTNKLIDAIRAGSLSGVLNALDDGEDIEMPDMHGCSGLPLRTACFEGNLAIVRELLNCGANPNAMASDGPAAPLRLALRKKHQDIVDLLLQKGAMPTDGMAIPSLLQDAPIIPLPEEVITSAETKQDNIVEFSSCVIAQPTGEATIPPPPDGKLGNLIEFSSSDLPLATNEADTPTQFGTDTSLLSMDLLFLEEDENQNVSAQAPEKR